MLTNPNTLGLFEEEILDIAAAVHDVGGLLYYDGANLNAILGVCRPGRHGLRHRAHQPAQDLRRPARWWADRAPARSPSPPSWRRSSPGRAPSPSPTAPSAGRSPSARIGRVHGWHGNALALARAWSYMLATGGDGLRRIAERAVLNATWLRHRLRGVYDLPYDRPNMHEFVASTATLKREVGLRASDVAKRLLEEGFHSPTVYFPLIVDEALMIEPTETESPETLAALGDALERIAAEARADGNADDARAAPRTTPVGRVDEARAARRLVPTFDARE